MVKITKILLQCSLLLSASASCSNLLYESTCWQISVDGAALYWLPCAHNFDYAQAGFINAATDQHRKELGVGPNYAWSYRIGATMTHRCCTFLCSEYTYFDHSWTTKASGGFIGTPTILDPNLVPTEFAAGTLGINYWTVNLQLGKKFTQCGQLCPNAFAGLRWVQIKRLDFADATLVNATPIEYVLNFSHAYRGLAIEAGGGSSWQLGTDCPCTTWRNRLAGLTFETRLSGMLLFGERCGTGVSGLVLTPASQTAVRFPASFACVTGLDARIGLSYSHAIRCLTLRVAVGYQVDYYLNALSQQEFVITSVGDINITNFADSNLVSIGWAGPYFSFLLSL